MNGVLLHIYGPFALHSFGLMIALGLLVFMWLCQKHPLRKKIMTSDTFSDVVLIGIVAALTGGRLLAALGSSEIFKNPWDILKIWEGGFSLLGSILGVLCVIPFYLKRKAIPILPFFDLVALHTPILQAFSRLGCFFAGCCYGAVSNVFWSVAHPFAEHSAGVYIRLHPTQLYSSGLSLISFFILISFGQRYLKKPGQLLAAYLALASLQRFCVDFFRGDREFLKQETLHFFSLHQWIALALFAASLLLFMYTTQRTNKKL